MRHPRCRGQDCNRNILPGQLVVWIPPATFERDGVRLIVLRQRRTLSGWAHSDHVRTGPLRITYAEDLDSIAVKQQLMRLWNEKGRPAVTDRIDRRRFDVACLAQIADIRTRAA